MPKPATSWAKEPFRAFYAGLSDQASLRYLARLLGDTEIQTRSRRVAALGGGRGSAQLTVAHAPLEIGRVHV